MPTNPRIVIPVICPFSINGEDAQLAWDNLLYMVKAKNGELNKTVSAMIKTSFMLRGNMNLSDLAHRNSGIKRRNVPYPESYDDVSSNTDTLMFSWNGDVTITNNEREELENAILGIVATLTGMKVVLGLVPLRKKSSPEVSE